MGRCDASCDQSARAPSFPDGDRSTFTALKAVAALNAAAVVDSGEGVVLPRLHELLYYAQGMSYAAIGEPLFDGEFVARTHGPELCELELRALAPGKSRRDRLGPDAGRPTVPGRATRTLRGSRRATYAWPKVAARFSVQDVRLSSNSPLRAGSGFT